LFVLDLEDSITINKPLKEVFAYVDDIEQAQECQSYLKGWEQSPGPNQGGEGLSASKIIAARGTFSSNLCWLNKVLEN
jgi:hypothetical protein